MTTAPVAPESDAYGARLYDEALRQGRAFLAQCTGDGTLVTSSVLRTRWQCSRQAIEEETRARSLFCVKVARKCWYPAMFLDLTSEDVKAVSVALAGCSRESQLVFWLRRHGGLAGKTVAQALQAGNRERAIEIASAWADENSQDARRAESRSP